MAAALLATFPVRAEVATWAVVLTRPKEDIVVGVDGQGVATVGAVTRPVGYIENIIVLDLAENPSWSPGLGRKIVPAEMLKIGDVVE